MNRRDFVLGTAALAAALPMAALAETQAYTPGLVSDALARGETVFVGYSADWCSTCKAQERVMDKLRAEHPAYDASMTFVRADWADFTKPEVTQSPNVTRPST